MRASTFLQVFEKEISEIPRYAVGPYFWFIPDNSTMSIVASSDNLHELLPFDKGTFRSQFPNFFEAVMEEEENNFFLGAVRFLLDIVEDLPIEERGRYRFNIYCRMQNPQRQLRWVMVQFPRIIYNSQGKGLSSLIVVSDLSHFPIPQNPIMTVIDTGNPDKPYYKAIIEQKKITTISRSQNYSS